MAWIMSLNKNNVSEKVMSYSTISLVVAKNYERE
jgi:hypothetical protein